MIKEEFTLEEANNRIMGLAILWDSHVTRELKQYLLDWAKEHPKFSPREAYDFLTEFKTKCKLDHNISRFAYDLVELDKFEAPPHPDPGVDPWAGFVGIRIKPPK